LLQSSEGFGSLRRVLFSARQSLNIINKYKRRSIRLKDYDYSMPGEYFVTICTYNKECLFGDMVGEEMRLNKLGKIVQEEWLRTTEIRTDVELDEFIIMPNHVHGIITLIEPVGANGNSPQNCNPSNDWAYIDTPLQKTKFCSPSKTIGAIIRGFKSAVTKHINELRSTPGIPIWQRGYYEHIIRTEKDLQNTREYIINNPLKWSFEKDNPENISL
jgi:putative transposase